MKNTTQLLSNIFLWLLFVTTSLVNFFIALIIRSITLPLDTNLRALHQFSCFWASLYIWLNPYWALRKKGFKSVDRKKTYVMVSNHMSMTDILILFNSFLHFKWVSKKSMFKVPLLGWNMALNGYVGIQRGDTDSREKMMGECRRWLKNGSSVMLFPEGTRSPDGKLQPFKEGAFRLAIETKKDILPLVIKGSHLALPKKSLMLSRQSKMTLTALPPVSIKPYLEMPTEKAVSKLMADVHRQYENELS